MKVIILASGRGSRLSKYTEDLPKGMLPLAGKPLLQRIVDAFRKVGLDDIAVTRGYKAEKIDLSGVRYIEDTDWSSSGIVGSLFCSEEEFDGSDDILVAYADTIYEPRIIQQIMQERFNLSKAIDVDYKEYWAARNGDWRLDSESCTLREDGSIVEIGEDGVTDPARLSGRDASLTFISKEFVPKVLEHYKKLKSTHWDIPLINGRKVREFNMSDLLQSWINNGWKVMGNKIRRGWMEFDTNSDYENALAWHESGRIKDFINLDLQND